MKERSGSNIRIPSEKPAVKTTIVGGRPPGSGKETDSVPRGIEVLIKKASVDPVFKAVLLKERSAAAPRISLSLENSEVNMLNSIPQPYLEGMISATKVSPNLRQVFLGCTAAVMLAALTTTACASDYDSLVVTRGITPGGIRPDTGGSQMTPESYFKKAESDAKLETGVLKVLISDRSSNQPLNSIKVHFIKVKSPGVNEQDRTEGVGYTSAFGIYRIEGVPVGEYSVEAANGSGEYAFQSKKIDIVASAENSLNFQLDRMRNAELGGIRPD